MGAQLHDDMVFVDEKRLSAMLGVDIKTVQGWRGKGGGPMYYKIGRCVRYKLSDVYEWVESKRRE